MNLKKKKKSEQICSIVSSNHQEKDNKFNGISNPKTRIFGRWGKHNHVCYLNTSLDIYLLSLDRVMPRCSQHI